MDTAWAQSMIGTYGLPRRYFSMAHHGRTIWDEVLEAEASSMDCVVSTVRHPTTLVLGHLPLLCYPIQLPSLTLMWLIRDSRRDCRLRCLESTWQRWMGMGRSTAILHEGKLTVYLQTVTTNEVQTENYTDNVDAAFSHKLYIQPNASIHGTDGYVHVSYPRYFYNQSRMSSHIDREFHVTKEMPELFLDGLQELGIPILTDPNNGTAAGGMLIPDSINPDNQTRSYARLNYFNGFIDRPNLHVTTHQHVTRVLVNAPKNVKTRDYPAGFWISGVEVSTTTIPLFKFHTEFLVRDRWKSRASQRFLF
jgi:hypothetical protein